MASSLTKVRSLTGLDTKGLIESERGGAKEYATAVGQRPQSMYPGPWRGRSNLAVRKGLLDTAAHCLVMRELIPLTTFLRQQSLPVRRI